jgi:hypothetical protein
MSTNKVQQPQLYVAEKLPFFNPEEFSNSRFKDLLRVDVLPYADIPSSNGRRRVVIAPSLQVDENNRPLRPWEEHPDWQEYGSFVTEGDPVLALREFCQDLGYVGLAHENRHDQYLWGPNNVPCYPYTAILQGKMKEVRKAYDNPDAVIAKMQALGRFGTQEAEPALAAFEQAMTTTYQIAPQPLAQGAVRLT